MAYSSSSIRNVVLVGHGGCGKTSLAEALLFLTGASNRLGTVLDKTSVMDFEPEEQKRGGSIATSLAHIEYNDHKINLLDTPVTTTLEPTPIRVKNIFICSGVVFWASSKITND